MRLQLPLESDAQPAKACESAMRALATHRCLLKRLLLSMPFRAMRLVIRLRFKESRQRF